MTVNLKTICMNIASNFMIDSKFPDALWANASF